ncbi:MAG TPA: hypothetical protein PLT58_03285 [Atribacterota bacterium]|nr:hypothetical protein [Atribacterota bacterium]HPK87073.1 hypothetical protein [Atribacterota bacterium]
MDLETLLWSVKNNLSYPVSKKKEKEEINRIIEAIQTVDRIYFVENREDAYYDTALSIGYNQTISQPSTVARMLMLAKLEKGQNLLELGAGSGWNACLAGFIIYPGRVLSLDIVPQLIDKARANLNTLKKSLDPHNQKKMSKVEFRFLNIFKELGSWPEKYDRIIITAGINETQEDTIFQLAEKILEEQGILVCPYTQGPLIILKKINGRIVKNTTRELYVFVPLFD